MTSRDESIPIGTVSAEQIKQAREGAAALDLAEIEARHAERVRRLDERDGLGSFPEDEHADIGALLAALREARADVERLRGGLALLAGEWERSGPPFELYGAHARELRALLAPAGTLASLDDACDGEPRPGEG